MPGLGKKTFTAGDVLIAGDVNNYLMDQTVMNFATTAARSSAIPVPSTGMVSYVGDTGTETPASTIPQIQAYTGAAWQNLDGMTLVASTSFTSVTTASINNVFNSSFSNYRVIVDDRKASDTTTPIMRLRAGGADIVGSNYIVAGRRCISWAGASTDQFFSGNDNIPLSDRNGDAGNNRYYVLDIINPALAEYTAYIISTFYYGDSGNFGSFFYNGYLRNTAVIDGLSFIFGNTATGRIRIYGYRNQ